MENHGSIGNNIEQKYTIHLTGTIKTFKYIFFYAFLHISERFNRRHTLSECWLYKYTFHNQILLQY